MEYCKKNINFLKFISIIREAKVKHVLSQKFYENIHNINFLTDLTSIFKMKSARNITRFKNSYYKTAFTYKVKA